jgi:hypothetical protein
MADITVAADEVAATVLLHDAEATLGTITRSGGPNALGPFNATWTASAFFTSGGRVVLIPSDRIRVESCQMHYTVHCNLAVDLNKILQPFCIHFPCFTIKIGKWIKIKICPPPICFSWPVVNIPFTITDVARFSLDLKLHVYLSGGRWHVDGVNLAVPNLQPGIAASAILTAIGLAASTALLPVPFIGLFLAAAVSTIAVSIGVAGVTGFLGPILTQFLTGLEYPLYDQPRDFTMLAANPPLDPLPVMLRLNELRAIIIGTNENELVLSVNISHM